MDENLDALIGQALAETVPDDIDDDTFDRIKAAVLAAAGAGAEVDRDRCGCVCDACWESHDDRSTR